MNMKHLFYSFALAGACLASTALADDTDHFHSNAHVGTEHQAVLAAKLLS